MLIVESNAQQPAVSKTIPSWLNKRPNSILKYVGIGMAEKNSTNYQNEAKKNALFDLSSEVKVTISSNSILHTIQNNNQFSENYNAMIQLSNTDILEGFQLIDTYENETQYWMYYELDKEEYEKLKAQKKQLTIGKAVNFINMSFDDEKEGDFTSALQKKIQAFCVLVPYLNEEINLNAKNNINSIFDLTNLIQKGLQAISLPVQANGITIKPFQLNYLPIIFDFVYFGGKSLKNFPFQLYSEDEGIRLNKKSSTGKDGKCELRLKTVSTTEKSISIGFTPDLKELAGNDTFVVNNTVNLLQKFIQLPELKTTIRIENINIYVKTTELNLSKNTAEKTVQQIILKKFNLPEVNLVESEEKADFTIECLGQTEKDISSDILHDKFGIRLVKLSLQLTLKNNKTNETLYSSLINDLYGEGNNLEVAGINAYNAEELKMKLNEALFLLKRKIISY